LQRSFPSDFLLQIEEHGNWFNGPGIGSVFPTRRWSVKEQTVTSFHLMLQTARRRRNFHSSDASRAFPIAFVVDRKLFAGVNAILRISSSELNRRLMIQSAASFRTRR
jgi:hypothetical protein